jgi:hypothetical protein
MKITFADGYGGGKTSRKENFFTWVFPVSLFDDDVIVYF